MEPESFENPFALPSPIRDEAPVPSSTPMGTPAGVRSDRAVPVPIQPVLGPEAPAVPTLGRYDTLGRSTAPRPRARLSTWASA